MKYIAANLLPAEKVLAEAKIHWFIFIPSGLFFLFVLVHLLLSTLVAEVVLRVIFNILNGTLLVTFGLLVLSTFLHFISTELALTNKRVISKTGFISRRTIEISLQRIESVQLNQGVLGRVFNFGVIIVTGTGDAKAETHFVADPVVFLSAVNKQIEQN